MEETIVVRWFEHDCPWITDYCYDYHQMAARVPLSVIKQYEVGPVIYEEPC